VEAIVLTDAQIWEMANPCWKSPQLFTVLEFARAIEQASRRAAIEECAGVCDDIEIDRWNLYKGRTPYTGSEDGRANPHVEGMSDGAGNCATAIRALATGDKID
jgi:hypothetical protein